VIDIAAHLRPVTHSK